MSYEIIVGKIAEEEMKAEREAAERGEETVDMQIARLRKKQRDVLREWHICEEERGWWEAEQLLQRAARIDRVIKMLLGR